MSSAHLHVCSQCWRTAGRRAATHLRPPRQQRSASSYSVDSLVNELPQSTRYSRPTPRPNSRPAPRSESLYDYVAASKSAHAPNRRQNADGRELSNYTSELDALVKKNDVAAAWSFFLTHYTSPDCPALDPTSLSLVDVSKHQSGTVYTYLVSLIADHWLDHIQSQPSSSEYTLPTPLEAIVKFDHLAINTSLSASRVAWSLAVQLQVAASKGVNIFENTVTKSVLIEVMKLWPYCIYPRGNKNGTDVPDYYRRFRNVVSRRDDKIPDFAASLLLIHDLVARIDTLPDDLEQYRPLLKSLDLAVAVATVSQAQLQILDLKLRRELMPEVFDKSLKPDELLRRLAKPLRATFYRNAAPKYRKRTSALPETIEQKIKTVVQKIAHAVQTQNLDILERMWISAQQILADKELDVAEHAASLLRMYESFLGAFFELRRPQSALQVWSSMSDLGIRPTVRTWNVMIKSCQYSRDIDIMEAMWRRMRDSGLQPDAVSWGTRIYGLLRLGFVREGMYALEEMGKEWIASLKQRAKSSAAGAPEAVKPDIDILNAAITALRGRRTEHIPAVLSWSRNFDIEPNIITYNALLNVSLKEGRSQEAMQILKRMAAANIKPDSATFTILLSSMLQTSLLDEMTHAEQEKKIMDVISSLEACGLTMNVQGYALLIDRMLKDYNNLSAAQEVLRHMMARKVERTPHIWTILMTHYFDADPPDFYAAEVLWNDIKSSKQATLDVIFYDRMVEGYARHGDVGRTMAFLNTMSKEGKRPGWLAMTAVIRCLALNHEWNRIAEIVVDCHKQEGLLSVGLRGRKGQKDFWEYVGSLAENELYDSEYGSEILGIVEAQREVLRM